MNSFELEESKKLHKVYQGMSAERDRVISTARMHLTYDKLSDFENQCLYRFLRKLYPDTDLSDLLSL